MKKVILTVLSIFVLGLTLSFAHAIWIETSHMGKKGVAQDVKVYFGEFGTDEISKASDWFADLSQFELELTHPDGKKTILPFKPNEDHFLAHFTPGSDGLYQIALHKVSREIYFGYKLDYMATAHVQVGDQRSFGKQSLPIAVRPATAGYQSGQPIDLSVLIDQDLAGEQEITVISPNTWTKKLYPDKESAASFTPLWPGKYLVETTVTDKNKGTFNGKEYSVNYHCHTYVLEVN